MPEETDRHAASRGETPTSRGDTAGPSHHETGTQGESGGSTASRRRFLKGGGASIAASIFATSAVSGMANTALGTNTSGVPVVVLQGLPGNAVNPQRRRAVIDRLYEEAVDRGREPPSVKYAMEGDDVQAGEPSAEAVGESGAATRDGDVVTFVSTVTDDGVPRNYLGKANSVDSTGLIHGRGMGRAKEFAERNGSAVEIHKPDGAVKTVSGNDIETARRAADVHGSTAGFNRALVGTDYARLDESYQRFKQQLGASLSLSAASYEEMNNYYDWESEHAKDPLGAKNVQYYFYHGDSGGSNDMYGIRNGFNMEPGYRLYNSDWRNNYGKLHHDWPEGEIAVDDIKDWEPYSTQGGSQSYGTSVSASLSSQPSVSFGYSYTYTQPDLEITVRTSDTNDIGKWEMDAHNDSTELNTIGFKPGSIAEQEAVDCSAGSKSFVRSWEEGGFYKDDCGCCFCNDSRDSIYDAWIHYVWC